MKLDGVSILVTGGASGLGAATAALLSRRGAAVTITDLPTAPGEENREAAGLAGALRRG